MTPEDDDQSTDLERHDFLPRRPRIATTEVLFDRARRDEHRDAVDALTALNGSTYDRC